MTIDYLRLDDELTEAERLIRDTVRRFAVEEAAPLMTEAYETGKFPIELVPRLAELGLLGAKIPEYGAGLGDVAYGLICQELEWADSGLRSFVSVQSSLCMYPIWRYGTEEQRRRWLPRLASGEAIGCFGLTEPDHGSDPGGMVTHAERDGAGWVLNGSKTWITNAPIADVAVVWARTIDGIRGFLVERGTPGFSTSEIHHKASMRASSTGMLHFDDCRLPADALLPGTKGLGSALACLNEARFGIGWGVIGAAICCFETALEYAKTRVQFDKPIAAFQLTQAKLVDLLATITKMQLLALRVGRLREQGKASHVHVSLLKRENVAAALEVARTARSILGANGISLEYPIIRHMENLETVLTYEGTHEIHTLILGQDLTGIGAFR